MSNSFIVIVGVEYDMLDVNHALGTLGDVAQLFENAFLVKTRYKVNDIYDELISVLEADPKVFICKLTKGSSYNNLMAASTEIDKLLPLT